jgi:glycosyltransferase involved in cell wall biosynthesis
MRLQAEPLESAHVENPARALKTGARVGVVTIGRNEGERLHRCLLSLKPLDLPIIYVDSGSRDRSVEIAQELGATVVKLDPRKMFTAARARNAGFQALRKLAPNVEFVQFLDGDCELADTWLDVALTEMKRRPDVAVVCGRRRERHPNFSKYNLLFDMEWDTEVGEAASCGGDALMRCDPFVAVDGFRPELLAGEEPELCARLRSSGWKIMRIGAEMSLHDAAMSHFRQWWRRGIRSGYGYAQVWAETWRSPFPLYGRELTRALAWGLLLPALIGLVTVVYWPAALLILWLYPAQVVRIAAVRGIRSALAWWYATLMVSTKFAEAWGACRFFFEGRRAKVAIDYKQ